MCTFLTGCIFFSPIPFYPKSFYNTVHFCRQCAQIVGTSIGGLETLGMNDQIEPKLPEGPTAEAIEKKTKK